MPRHLLLLFKRCHWVLERSFVVLRVVLRVLCTASLLFKYHKVQKDRSDYFKHLEPNTSRQKHWSESNHITPKKCLEPRNNYISCLYGPYWIYADSLLLCANIGICGSSPTWVVCYQVRSLIFIGDSETVCFQRFHPKGSIQNSAGA